MRTTILVLALAGLTACGGSSGGNGGGGSSSTSSGKGGGSASGPSSGAAGGTSSQGNGGSATTGSGSNLGACDAGGAEITTLPTCSTPDTSTVTVPSGCTPTVDGTLHAAEWSDGACFNVEDMGGMVVVLKSSGDALYMATSGQPTCGCGMGFYFLPASGSAFMVSVFDDPFGKDGDRGDFTFGQGGLTMKAQNDPNIVTACPGNMPTPIRYEWKIPLTTLGLTSGSAGQFKLAITHAGKNWPSGLAVDAMTGIPTYASGQPTWGGVKSSSW